MSELLEVAAALTRAAGESHVSVLATVVRTEGSRDAPIHDPVFATALGRHGRPRASGGSQSSPNGIDEHSPS